MVGYFINAVVGDVGDGHAEFGGGINRDVVHADAESADGDAVGGGFQHIGGDLGEAGHNGVHVCGEGDEGVFVAVGRDYGLGVRFFAQDGLLRLGGGARRNR